MWPKIGSVNTYGIFYLSGIVMHFVISWRTARKLYLRRSLAIVVSLCYLIGMVPGAKFLFHWHHVGFDPMVIFSAKHYLQGGLWGGLLVYMALAVPIVLLCARRRRDALDLTAMTLPIPWALAKVGCLLNGCCNGRPSSVPWAITFPEGCSSTAIGVPVHPCQIYEIIIMVLVLVVFRMLRSNVWRGTRLFWFVALYGLGRAATDVFRGDIDRHVYIGPVTLTQMVCLVSAAASLATLVCMRHWSGKSEDHCR